MKLKYPQQIDYCVDCGVVTTKFCRRCGVPVCPSCSTADGLCLVCDTNDDDDEYFEREPAWAAP
jgi:hypothetical protein